MKRVLVWVLVCTLAAALCPLMPAASASSVQAASLVSQSNAVDGMMRISLSSMQSNSYNLTVDGTYTMAGMTLSSGSRVLIELNNGTVYATYNGSRMSMGASVSLARQSGGIRIAESSAPSNTYPGNLTFMYTGGVPYVICTVYMEDYVKGVLPYEMDNTFPLEALKAQAVAARTYAIRNKKSGGLYDVTDTVNHQVYRGTNSGNGNCIQAVDATKGIVMRYNGSYVDATYCASNGGQTELNSNAWGSNLVGYLTMKDDPYDLANPSSITKSYMLYKTPAYGTSTTAYSMISAALAAKRGGTAAQYAINEIVDVSLHSTKFASPSRLYTQMRVTVRFNNTVQDSVDIAIFPTVESAMGLSINSSDNELYTVIKESNGFRISARRYGHGVGMSQRGAQQMANSGLTYRHILGFYYTGVQLVEMNFTTNWSVANPSVTPLPTLPSGTSTTAKKGRVSLANTSNRLNLRQTPSISSGVVTRLNHGTEVTILSEVDSWYQVQYGTLTGYAAKEFIVVQQTGATTDPGASTANTAYVSLQSGRLNMRSEARATATVVGSIPNGAQVTIVEAGTAWSKISYGGTAGYVMTHYLNIPQTPGSSTNQTANTAVVSLSNPGGTLNLRMNPSTTSAVLLQLRHGAVLTVVEKSATWSKVTVQNVTGYVMNSYVTFSTGTNNTLAPTVTPTPVPSVQTWKGIVSLTSGNLNLRSQPNNSAGVVTQIPNGATVTVTSLGDTWCAVTYGSYSGYVSRRYLYISNSAAGTVTAAPTPVPTASAQYAWVKTQSGGNVNLRRAPSADGSVEMMIPHGAQVRVMDAGATWSYVQYGTATGYVSTQFLVSTNPNPGGSTGTNNSGTSQTAATYGYIKTASGGPVNLRQSASASSTSLTQLPYGTRVQIVADGTEWIKVRTDSYTGYVAADYISIKEPAAVSGSTATQNTGLTGSTINTGSLSATQGADSVVIYKEPILGSDWVGTLNNGTSITVLMYAGGSGEWMYIRSGSTQGYILRSEARLNYRVGRMNLQNSQAMQTVYATASSSAQSVTSVQDGTYFTVVDASSYSGWVLIRLVNGVSGYVPSALVLTQ